MAERGFAALPVVDDDGAVVGIVAEADVLRDRLPQDPRLHLRRQDPGGVPPPPLVRGVMTTRVRTVPVTADVADVARLFVDQQLRSVPVVDGERLAGIVSRRDLLRTLVRPDDEIASDVRHLVEAYTGRSDGWTIEVAEGVVTLDRSPGAAAAGPAGEDTGDGRAVLTLARTVPGVVLARLAPSTEDSTPTSARPP